MDLANSIISLQPGIYILRHPKDGLPPISISRAAGAPTSVGRIEALYTPKTDGGVLRDSSDCIVMQVLNAPVDLLVTAYLEHAGAAVPTLKIDKIALDADTAATPLGAGFARPIQVPDKGLSIIGHIERTGDVVASPGQQLGEPTGDLRVEGFQVMWPDKPEGVDLEYSLRIEGAGETPKAATGSFCGKRNVAARVVGLTMNLVGPNADQFKLTGEASFSGGYASELIPGSPMSGPSGMEHLTGLRIDVKPATGKKASGPWAPSAKTKVFKGNSRKK